jgi:autotransporter-associated beta strand protein
MIPFCKSTVTGVRPFVATWSGNCTVLFLVLSFLATKSLFSDVASTVLWGTQSIDGEVPNETLKFYGLNLAGDSTAVMAKTAYAGASSPTVSTKGNFVELGYFASDAAGAPSATSGDLFLGKYWIPLTSATMVGIRHNHHGVGEATFQNADGEIWANTVFGDQASDLNKALTYKINTSPDYSITDSITNLEVKLDALDDAANAYLAIRFYDVDPEAATGGVQSDLNSNTKKSRYNTITSSDWLWTDRSDVGNPSTLAYFHDPDDADADNLYSTLKYEMTNESYGTVEIGTGGSNTLADLHGAGSTDGSDSSSGGNAKRTATIAYRDATALDLANTGDTIVSNLDDAVSAANIAGHAATAYDLTVMARSTGTTYTYSGVISNKVDIHKIGAGTQEFTGAVNTTGVLSIDQGPLTLKPGSNLTQSFEYLTDDNAIDSSPGTLAIDNSGGANHVVELGFASTTTAQTFAGAITLSNSGVNTLKVGGVTASDFDDHQKFTGIIGDDGSGATLKKTGSGKLTLSGDNTFTGGITIADGGGATDGGIVVAGHADALGAGTTTIEHGKLSVAGGITVANAIAGQGTNDNTDMKSVIGGGVGDSVGTITNDGNILNIGSGNNEVDVVSPGIAHASSMSNGTSDYQVIGGNKNDAGAVAVANSIGTMKINTLGLKAGGVFDWEIRDFEGGNGAGADWDVLQFDALTLGAKSDRFAINIYGVAPDGSAGKQDFSVSAAGSKNLLNKTGSFAFLTGGTVDWNGASGGNGSQWSDTEIDDYFVINADAFHSSNSYWGNGGWGVSYAGGNFILGYSAVPEPSTYVMVTGLLMLPGFQFLRRFRKRKNKGEE